MIEIDPVTKKVVKNIEVVKTKDEKSVPYEALGSSS